MAENPEHDQFDPRKYIKPLSSGGKFLPVVAKIAWFRGENPQGKLETRIIEHTIGDYAVIQVTATSDTGGVGAGLGIKFFVDYPKDYLQRAETTARGRALEALGYSLTEAADDAGDDYSPPQNSGKPTGGNRPPQGQPPRQTAAAATVAARAQATQAVSKPTAAPQGNAGDRPVLPATEAQIRACYAIARGAQAMDEAEVNDRCRQLYGTDLTGLSRRQASEFIDTLKAPRQE